MTERIVRGALRLARAVWLAVWFLGQLVAANAMIAFEVVTPRHYMRPGIAACPVRCTRDLEITLLANLISLTPGTLSLEVDRERRLLYVHGLHATTPDQLRRHVRRLEDRILAVTDPRGRWRDAA